MTLRNVPHHFAKYHRGGTKPSEDCTFSFWLGSSCVEGHPPSPALPPHPHHTAPRFPYWSLSGAEFDMRHISPGLELSLRGPHLRSIIRLAAPGETGRRGGGRRECICVCFGSSINLNASERTWPIKMPSQDQLRVKRPAGPSWAQDREGAGAGPEGVKDSYAID